MSPEHLDMVIARSSQTGKNDLAVAFVLLYASFLDQCTKEQCVGILSHRGLTESEALKVFELNRKLTD